MPRGWLKDLDLIQIKAALWQGDSPLSISRQFLVTQGTISAIKHGRLHPEAEWPDGSTGPIPPYKETELLRMKRMGMLRASEIKTGRGHMARDTHLRMPPPVERERTEKEIWWGAHKDAEKEDGSKYTHEELEQAWLIEEQERKNARDTKAKELHEQRRKLEEEQRVDEQNTPEETAEEREQWDREQRQETARRNLWTRKGEPILDNIVAANLTKKQVLQIMSTDSRGKAYEQVLLQNTVEAREEAVRTAKGDHGRAKALDSKTGGGNRG